MTDVQERIEAIRERTEAATEGPWGYVSKLPDTNHDRRFKVAARTDIPWLLSRLEEVGRALAALPDQHYHGIANRLEQMKNGERVADRLDALRDAAQEGA